MSVNGVTNSSQTYESNNTAKTKSSQSQAANDASSSQDSTAAVYEKSDQAASTTKLYKTDTATVERLKAEADKRYHNLRGLVEKMMLKQGQTYTDSTDIYSVLREGKVQVNPETSAQAKKDIADDGYWGVNQTSDRMLSFAKALAGGDPSKADELINAVKKGFEEATKSWGDALPDICKKTMDETIKKMEAWRDGKEGSDSMSNAAANSFQNQAATKAVAE